MAMAERYRFEDFLLDAGNRRLSRDGAPVELNSRTLDALLLLVRNPGQLVGKDRFLGEVWRGIPVTDEALTQCIRTLRRALGDEVASPRFIETVPKHGYRFIADVRGPAAKAARGGRVARDAVAAGLGGALAGIVGGLAYVSAGLVLPGLGTASVMLALISLCLGLGLAGGLAIGLGLALAGGPGRAPLRAVAGGGLGGLAIGAFAAIVGRDLLSLLFGQAPRAFTGALEAAALGAGVGLAAWLAHARRDRPALGLASAFVIGAGVGVAIALAGGQLLAGSLAELGRSFPQSSLRFAALPGPALAAATAFEAGLFCLCVTAAQLAARRVWLG